MPAQKRSSPENDSNGDEVETPSPPLQNGHQSRPKQSRRDASPLGGAELRRTPEEEEELEDEEDEAAPKAEGDGEEEDEQEEEEEEDEKSTEEGEGEDSEDSESPISEEEKPEFVFVELPEIRKDVQCPICLGIIKKTRTVMECLHRFCRECIDKSMRLGNNECPACRTHCASRRSLRDDPNYDALIAAMYPDIDKYEEEELAFHEEERTRNKQIQASIAQIFQRQTEALSKRKTTGKETAGPFMAKSQRNHRTNPSRKRRNSRVTEFLGCELIGEENDDKDSFSSDERSTEARNRRRKRRSRPYQPSSSASNLEGGSNENDVEAGKENRGLSPGLVWNTEMLAWGRGGVRSHTRHGNSSGNSKNPRNTRLLKLVEYLRSLEEKNDELDVHLMLVSLDKQSAPNLQQPYLCCRPSLSVKQLRDYVALQTPMQAEDIEILLVKGKHKPAGDLSNLHPPISVDELQILDQQETLSTLGVNCTSNRERLILGFRQKGVGQVCPKTKFVKTEVIC